MVHARDPESAPQPSVLNPTTDRRLVPRFLIGAPIPTVGVTVILALFGIALIVQSSRFSMTPAYGLLLHIVSADVWGVLHLIAATAMTVSIIYRQRRIIGIVAHTFTVILLAVWELFFIVRYVTDVATTPINPLNWATLLFLAIWSSTLIDWPTLS